jgi:hypothetical protein
VSGTISRRVVGRYRSLVSGFAKPIHLWIKNPTGLAMGEFDLSEISDYRRGGSKRTVFGTLLFLVGASRKPIRPVTLLPLR